MAKRLKEMVYEPKWTYKLLYEEEKDGYRIAIVSYGMHPCAYVSVPKSHPFYGKGYDEVPVECHFGLTFSEPNNNQYIRWNKNFADEDIWWLGWDYAHCDDYSGSYMLPGFGLPTVQTRWTTRLILDECYDVVEQLKKAVEKQ